LDCKQLNILAHFGLPVNPPRMKAASFTIGDTLEKLQPTAKQVHV